MENSHYIPYKFLFYINLLIYSIEYNHLYNTITIVIIRIEMLDV